MKLTYYEYNKRTIKARHDIISNDTDSSGKPFELPDWKWLPDIEQAE